MPLGAAFAVRREKKTSLLPRLTSVQTVLAAAHRDPGVPQGRAAQTSTSPSVPASEVMGA